MLESWAKKTMRDCFAETKILIGEYDGDASLKLGNNQGTVWSSLWEIFPLFIIPLILSVIGFFGAVHLDLNRREELTKMINAVETEIETLKTEKESFGMLEQFSQSSDVEKRMYAKKFMTGLGMALFSVFVVIMTREITLNYSDFGQVMGDFLENYVNTSNDYMTAYADKTTTLYRIEDAMQSLKEEIDTMRSRDGLYFLKLTLPILGVKLLPYIKTLVATKPIETLLLESMEETLSTRSLNERSQTKTPYTTYITSLLPFGVNDLLRRLTESTVIDDAKHLVTHAGKEEMRVSNFIKKFHHAMPGSYQGFSWEFASSFVSSTWAIFTHLTMLNESNTEGVVETMAYLMALPRHSRITMQDKKREKELIYYSAKKYPQMK